MRKEELKPTWTRGFCTKRPQVGQIWRENDPRFERLVEVLVVDDAAGRVQIRMCSFGGAPKKGPRTWARLERFDGRVQGYMPF